MPFVKSVRNLGVVLDWRFSMKEHINKMCQMAYWELRRISYIRQYLTEDTAKTLVVFLVLSSLDYGNCLLAGVPKCLLHQLQKASSRLILRSSRQEHTKPLLKALYCLPISDRITYKLSCMCYNSVTASTPQYLADLLQNTPSRTLQSTADTRKLKIALFKKEYSSQRSFSYQGPVTWNNLPSPSATHKHTPHLSHNWKPTSSHKIPVEPIFEALCIWFAIMRCFDGPCIILHCMSGLHWLFRDAVHVCLRFAVDVGSHVSCTDSDVHSRFELWSALSQTGTQLDQALCKSYVLLLWWWDNCCCLVFTFAFVF